MYNHDILEETMPAFFVEWMEYYYFFMVILLYSKKTKIGILSTPGKKACFY